jgi:pyroglutamyl-peptidase
MRRSLLIAGFGSFPGQKVNPAEIVTRLLARRSSAFAVAGIDLHTAILPVEYFALSPTLSRLFAEKSPDAVILLGVAARRRRLTVETRARNRASILKPDAAKQRAYCREIVHGGPDIMLASAEAPRLAALARQLGQPASLSRDAGDYLCNESLYLALLMDRKATFLHLPRWRGATLRRGARAIEAMAKNFALS